MFLKNGIRLAAIKVVNISAQRRKIVERKQRIARAMVIAGLPLHQVRQALGVVCKAK